MTVITATELKLNLGKYLSRTSTEEIGITKNGKLVARLVPAKEYKADSLIGVLGAGALPKDFDGDYRELLWEMRMRDYESLD